MKLGAVYSLIYAAHHDYTDRSIPLAPADIQSVSKRAADMSELRVRTDGQWTAGYYLNSALFRIAAVLSPCSIDRYADGEHETIRWQARKSQKGYLSYRRVLNGKTRTSQKSSNKLMT